PPRSTTLPAGKKPPMTPRGRAAHHLRGDPARPRRLRHQLAEAGGKVPGVQVLRANSPRGQVPMTTCDATEMGCGSTGPAPPPARRPRAPVRPGLVSGSFRARPGGAQTTRARDPRRGTVETSGGARTSGGALPPGATRSPARTGRSVSLARVGRYCHALGLLGGPRGRIADRATGRPHQLAGAQRPDRLLRQPQPAPPARFLMSNTANSPLHELPLWCIERLENAGSIPV